MKGDPILSRDYWRDPVQVFTGMTWLLIGSVIGFMIAQVAA